MLAPANTIRNQIQQDRPDWSAIGLVVAVHGALIAGLLQIESVRTAVTTSSPVLVSFISPQEMVRPDVLPQPPKVQAAPVARLKPLEQLPLITAPADMPSTAQMEAPKAEPATFRPMQESAKADPQLVTPPDFNAAYLENPPPVYPAISRRTGEQGRVLLRVFVSAEGRADNVTIHSSSSVQRLDLAAQEAVRRWRFIPAKQGNNAVAAWVIVPIIFQLGR